MVTPINSRDVYLQSLVPRVIQISTNYLTLTAPSLQFKYGSDNLPQPTQIIVTANLLGRLAGTVTFTSTGLNPAPQVNPSNPNQLIILPGSFTGDFVTINASVVWQGATYQAVPISISKIYNQLFAKIQRPIDLVPSYNDGSGYTLPTASNFVELYNGVNKVTEALVYGPATQTLNGLTLAVNTTTGEMTLSQTAPNTWTGTVANFNVSVVKNFITYTATYNITKAKAGVGGTQANEIYLYRWSVGQPALPTGTSLYTWTTNTHTYGGADGWTTTIPTNPGTVGIGLWKATKLIIAEASLVNLQLSTTWATGSTIQLVTTEANDLIKTYRAKVYKNDTGIPGILGTSTLTWSTKAFTAPSGWGLTAPGDVAGLTLYVAEVFVQAANSQSTSTIDWTQSSITPLSYYGTDGTSARRAYVIATTTPSGTPTSFIATGDTLPTTGTWFTGKTWAASAPALALAEGETVYQSDGVYVSGGNTTWGYPYISTLKVGNLQAISANTGNLTVSGSMKGGLATSLLLGDGYYFASDGKFRVGKAAGARVEWDGSGLVIYNPSNQAILSAGNFTWDAVTGTGKTSLIDNVASLQTNFDDIVSDSLLTPDEKPSVIKERDILVAEQAGISALATTYGITTLKTNYQTTVTALTTYLATLTLPVLWSNLTGNTIIVGTTFRTKFTDVYTAKQALLNATTDAAKTLADAAQVDADAANLSITNISSDSLLTPDEKPSIIQNYDVIIAEQAGLGTQATAYSITTEKTTYDTAITTLTNYLATLTTPVLWNNLTGNTTIVGTTFRTRFKDVYVAKQALLNKIVGVTKTTLDNKLAKTGASILSGTISMDAVAGAGFVAGNLVWNASGVRTSGSGVAMTPGGLVGHNGTKTTFTIGTDGNATFGGTVEAAVLKSTDNKFVIDLANKFISITT